MKEITTKEKNTEIEELLPECSDELHDVMGNVSPWILRWGITTVFSIIIIILIGSYYFRYPNTLTAKVMVKTSVSSFQVISMGEIFLPSVGSGKVKKGQRVNIHLDNYPSAEFGCLIGEVRSISGIPDLNGFYHIQVAFPNGLYTNYGRKLSPIEEMMGTANIILENQRLIERFVQPFNMLIKSKE